MYTTWIELNASALKHNSEQVISTIGPAVTLGFVVKGNAYGHGLAEIITIARTCPAIGYYFVAALPEALELRAWGITQPICAMVPVESDCLEEAITQEISCVCAGPASLALLARTAQHVGKPALVHIKIDTGLSRLGACPSEALGFCEAIFKNKWLKVTGVMTHLANIVSDDITRAHEQLRCFDETCARLKKAGYTWEHTHACASGSVMYKRNDSLVRVGTTLYGYWKSPAQKARLLAEHPAITLQPVLSWKTRIWEIRDIAAGNYVGYGETFYTKQPMRIAILPVGYADGYPRDLSNQGVVMVRGQYAPIVGRVSMNLAAIDITHVPEALPSDEVLLLGSAEKVTADAIAEKTQTINLDILTHIGSHISRIIA
jgi:alanine racemase